jgi:photosynthetic reaction center cytochrome c subunit
MLPEWFNKWNRENPTDIEGPAILIGAVGGAVVLATLVIAWGYPFQTETMQTGPRGSAMGVVQWAGEAEAPDPDIADYYTEAVYLPGGGEALARDVYDNVQVLGDLTEDNFNRLMNAMTAWVSPDQGCAYCHGDGDLETYGEDALYTKVVARRMIQMTQTLNEGWGDHVNASGEAGVNCYTCHRGQNVPSDIWFRIDPGLETVAGWSANQNLATVQTVSTSLPHDALQTLLVDYGRIAVHDLEPRVPNEGTATIQDTERTYSLMNYFADSLGVNCTFCHNSRAFYDTAQVTPQWGNASLGIGMVLELNNEYLNPLVDAYPSERLGPVHADAPKAACRTCHKGAQKPLGGMNMIADWPELATTGALVYE